MSSVAGGTTLNVIPLDIWREGIEAEGYTPSTAVQGRDGTGFHKYTWYDSSGIHHTDMVSLVKIKGKWYVKVK